MTDIRSLCVLCGSREGNDPAYREAAIRLGMLMVRHGIRLVYGGGSIGLMGIVADAVLAAGGQVTGVIPDFLIRREAGHSRLSELIVTGSMHDRKRRMFEMADAFVVLPGGLGTLDETFEIVTWKQIRLHDRPIVVLDVGNYWAPLRNVIKAAIDAGFAPVEILDLLSFVSSPDEIFDVIAAAPDKKEAALTSHL